LFLELADLDATPDAIREFANEYGPLGVDHNVLRQPTEPIEGGTGDGDGPAHRRLAAVEQMRNLRYGDTFDTWKSAIREMNAAVSLFRAWKAGGGGPTVERDLTAACDAGLSTQQIRVAVIPAGGLTLVPETLLAAAWVQLAAAVAGDKAFHRCPGCTRWVEVSDRGRSDQRYCGPACRAKAYRERQAEAARRADAGESPEVIAEALGTTPGTVRGWLAKRS
jgi:hypothetical protein